MQPNTEGGAWRYTWGLQTIDYFLPLVLGLIISVGVTSTMLAIGAARPLLPQSRDSFESIVIALILALIGLLGATGLYQLVRMRKAFAVRLIFLAIFAPWVAMMTVILGQALLLGAVKGSGFARGVTIWFAFIFLLSIYASILFAVLVLMGSLPVRIRNVVYVVYGSMIGAFVGVSLSTGALVAILTALALYDLLVVRRFGRGPDAEDIALGREPWATLSFSGLTVEVGIGEFIVYAIIAAHALGYFGTFGAELAVTMVLIGAAINLIQLGREGFVAGFPIPTLLGILPIICLFLFG